MPVDENNNLANSSDLQTPQLSETVNSLRSKWGEKNGCLAQCVENGGIYKYDSTSEGPDDGDTTIRPIMTGVGRWVRIKEFTIVNF